MAVSTIPLASAVSGTLPDGSAPSGSVIQVVSATSDSRTNVNSTSFTAVGAAASITPRATSSRIAVFVSSNCFTNNTQSHQAFYTLYRDSTNLGNSTQGFGWLVGSGSTDAGSINISYVDSPSTTSSVTYRLYGRTSNSESTVEFSGSNGVIHSIVLMEIAA
jgi:hypothetical protein